MIQEKWIVENKTTIIKSFFDNLEPFNGDVYKIPDIPKMDNQKDYQEIIVKNLIRCGAIPKKDLIVGKTYIGDTRNTTKATWDGEKFIYDRYKWGTIFKDDVNHFEDDNGYALFVPIKMID